MKFVNCTPHPIVMNDGRVFEPCGEVARVNSSFTDIEGDFCEVVYGDIHGIPAPKENTFYIVSAMVKGVCDRDDVVAPATGHADTKRNYKGHIVSVPCFII